MTKLLSRPLKAFTIYSLLILLISIPAYFLVVDYIWLEEMDEQNWLTVQHVKKKLQRLELESEDLIKIDELWGTLQPGASISPAESYVNKADSIYEIIRPNEYDFDNGLDRFRGLQSFVEINGLPYRITIETNVEEADETLLAIALVTFFFFIVLILGFIILNRRIALNSWKPFYQTLQSLKSFDLSKDKQIRLDESDIYEFQELNNSLNQLVERNISSYQQQKSFTENASHELQTPIALLKSRLDLLLQEKGVTSKISEILNSIEAPLSRLSRINKNLLLLAKVENHQYEEQESVNIRSYIENSLALFEDYSVDKNLQLKTILDAVITVKANPFLFETLTNNLLSNAIRHSPAGAHIAITIENCTLIFTNSGTKALDSDKLFKRFSAVSKEVVGSGLGLAIVKEIATKYRWVILYSFQDQKHTFSVTF